MARKFARVNVMIWSDDDFRDLPAPAQHLYFALWTHPSLSYCGVVDWRPGKLAALSAGWSKDDVERAAECLEARLFIVIDHESEECLIRSWAKHDGLLKEPRMAVSFANAYATVGSRELQGVIVHEAHRLREAEPSLPGWSKPQVIDLLTKRAVDPALRPTPEDPFGPGFDLVSPGFGVGLAQSRSGVSVPPTPSPTPTPYSSSITPTPHGKRPTADSTGFDDFWAAYPKRADKGHARTAWAKAVRKADVTAIIEGARRFGEDPNLPEPKFIPLAATWLNGERWDDGPLPDRRGSSNVDTRVEGHIAIARQLHEQEQQQGRLGIEQ